MKIANLSRLGRTAKRVGMVLLTAVLSASVGAAPAHAAVVSPADGVVPGFHVCENFGIAHRGYIAGHCGDFFEYTDPTGRYVEAQGQSFCQLASTHAIVQCAGIRQVTKITNLATGDSQVDTFVCGRFAGQNPACPSGRFENRGRSLRIVCYDFYQVDVNSTVDLPLSGDEVVSQEPFGPTARLC